MRRKGVRGRMVVGGGWWMRVGRMMRVVKWENEEGGRLGENGGRRRMVDEGGR